MPLAASTLAKAVSVETFWMVTCFFADPRGRGSDSVSFSSSFGFFSGVMVPTGVVAPLFEILVEEVGCVGAAGEDFSSSKNLNASLSAGGLYMMVARKLASTSVGRSKEVLQSSRVV